MEKMTRTKPQKWSRRELVLFFERLELFISSGLPLNIALENLIQGAPKKRAVTIQEIKTEIESGSALSRSLKSRIKISSTVIGLIEHGENSGELAKAANYSKQLLEREDELVKKCLSAMAYPLVIGLFALAMTIGLMKGVMPQIVPMLKNLRVPLPLLTRAVMRFSDLLSAYGLHFMVFAAATILVAVILYKKSTRLRNACQSALSRVPILGNLVYSYFASVFIRSLGSLVESGMPLASAYVHAVSSASFNPLKQPCARRVEEISSGVALSSAMATLKRLPAFIPSLISAGERTASLGTSLGRCAAIMDKDIEHSLKRLISLVEPVMMIGMGCAVGAIALSIIMPIYDISKTLQH